MSARQAVPGRFCVQVPATSANLGSGFDSLGLGLDLWDTYRLTKVATVGTGDRDPAERPGGAWSPAAARSEVCRVHVEGEGAGTVAPDEGNLVVSAMRAAAAELGVDLGGFSLHCDNRIPHGRGLGSSAAAIVGGVLAGRALAGAGRDRDAELAIAARLEGHPDNVAAALFGGLTVAWYDDDGGSAPGRTDPVSGLARAVGLSLLPLRIRVFVPTPERGSDATSAGLGAPSTMSTVVARGLLPAMVPHADAAAQASRAALLVAALTHADLPDRRAALFAGTRDRLHQDARTAVMPATGALLAALRVRGVAADLSGSGPAVLALDVVDGPPTWSGLGAPKGWSALDLRPCGGATCRRLEP